MWDDGKRFKADGYYKEMEKQRNSFAPSYYPIETFLCVQNNHAS